MNLILLQFFSLIRSFFTPSKVITQRDLNNELNIMEGNLESGLELSCNIEKISEGAFKNLYILNLSCKDNIKINVDMPKEINIFKDNQNVQFILSKNKPQYTKEDFCAHGYVVTEKTNNSEIVTLISLFGLLIRISSLSGLVKSGNFSIMDHVYVCIKKI